MDSENANCMFEGSYPDTFCFLKPVGRSQDDPNLTTKGEQVPFFFILFVWKCRSVVENNRNDVFDPKFRDKHIHFFKDFFPATQMTRFEIWIFCSTSKSNSLLRFCQGIQQTC